MKNYLKNPIFRASGSAIIFVLALILPVGGVVQKILFLTSYLLVGATVLRRAAINMKNGRMLDENFLMSIASIGAFAIGECAEAIAVMLLYQIGEIFQGYAVGKSRRSIADLMDIRPDYANVERGGEVEKVDPSSVAVGEIILVRPGEKIPLDGVVVDGTSSLDVSALTGESMPRDVGAGGEVFGGSINLSGVIRIKTSKVFAESTVSKILDLVENASNRKANLENFITRFARYYTPIVVSIAVIIAILPPLFGLGNFNLWLYRAIVFLVISCPCALVISVPLSFFGGIGASSRHGILVKGSNYLEMLARTKYVVFDKTGTLTQGKFKVSRIEPVGISAEELLDFTAHVEVHSNHPIAESIRQAYGGEIDSANVGDIRELPGMGVEGLVGEKKVAAGNLRLMSELGLRVEEAEEIGTTVYVAIDGKYAGYISVSDQVKDDSKKAIESLKNMGVRRTIMLTGDREKIANRIANELHIDKVYHELMPADKVQKVEEIMAEKSPSEALAFVGDGVNDAPALARSDVGVAMGSMGSDAAIEAADIVIMGDSPSKIATAMRISRSTVRVAKQNTTFAIAVKMIVLVAGALGFTSIWAAVFADVGVSVLAIMNAVRVLYIRVDDN